MYLFNVWENARFALFNSFSVVEYDIIYVKYYKMLQSRVFFCYYDKMNTNVFILKVSAKLRCVQKACTG